MKTLFDIEQSMMIIFDELESNGGELTPELEAALEISQKDLANKGLNYVHVIKKYENEIEGLKVYEEQIAKLKKRKTKAAEYLKDRLLDAVKKFGPIETEIFTITSRKSESVVITDEDKLPMFCYKNKTVSTVDKEYIKAQLKKGLEIPGAEISVNQNLSIK